MKGSAGNRLPFKLHSSESVEDLFTALDSLLREFLHSVILYSLKESFEAHICDCPIDLCGLLDF